MWKRTNNRIISLMLFAVMVVSLLPMSASAEFKINIGDYIRMGTYDGESVLWRCVAVDDNGPLMLSDRVLCEYLPYDARTSENSATGSH